MQNTSNTIDLSEDEAAEVDGFMNRFAREVFPEEGDADYAAKVQRLEAIQQAASLSNALDTGELPYKMSPEEAFLYRAFGVLADDPGKVDEIIEELYAREFPLAPVSAEILKKAASDYEEQQSQRPGP